jgi:sugar transferase (PEP-CTERM/EpsH1 system associated)
MREGNELPPLIVHVIHELSMGGLENGLVNLINHMPAERYRHAIVCMTHDGGFRNRIRQPNVPVYALHRDECGLSRTYWGLYRLLQQLRPAIVHSRNLSGLDALVPAFCAGVPMRIHGEHGRDMDDLDGSNAKYRRIKKAFRPLVTRYTAVSMDLALYLHRGIGVPKSRISQIYNGVDTEVFRPAETRDEAVPGKGARFVVGTVGRLQPVKDHVSLVRAFAAALALCPEGMKEARLVIAGEGSERSAVESRIAESGLQQRVKLLGARDDIPDVLRDMELFVLPSLAEGISNTILEAMASGLPVLATRVGGNSELVEDGRAGSLVSAGDWRAMAEQIAAYADDRARLAAEGRAAREIALRRYSMQAMVEGYLALYDRLVAERKGLRAGWPIRKIS